MIYAHFLKLMLEAIFLQRLAGRMMPLNRILFQVLFYWVFLGGIVPFFFYHPEYKDSFLLATLDGEGRFVFASIVTVIFLVA
jgi:hypothetical protein